MSGPRPLLPFVLASFLLLPGCLGLAPTASTSEEAEGEPAATGGTLGGQPSSLDGSGASALQGVCETPGVLVEEDHTVPLTEELRVPFEVAPGCGLVLKGRFSAMVGSVTFRILQGDAVVAETDGGASGPLLVGSPDFRTVASPLEPGTYTLVVTPTQAVSFRVTVEAEDAASLGMHR